MQYKPVCVTNFDEVYWSFWYSYSSACVTSYWIRLFCLRCYALLRLDKKLILLVYVLRTYFYVVMPMCCVMSHSTLQ